MRTSLFVLAAAVSAMVIPLQAIINGRLGQTVANPLLASLISFLAGTVVLTVILFATTPGLPALPKDLGWTDIPPYLFLGGVLGAVFVTAVLMLVPRIGAANVLAAGITGQLVMALIVDHFAILGVPQSSVSLTKIGGCLLLIGGMLLIQRG
jgi:transporter family-2 protein